MRTLLLVHGFTHTGASWGPVVRVLGERYRAVAPDLWGHGSASDVRPVTLEAVLDDLVEEMPETFALCGYSMGGRIASQAVAQGLGAEGLVFLGYPLHPPGRFDTLRDKHLTSIAAPLLFVQGTRDAFARSIVTTRAVS